MSKGLKTFLLALLFGLILTIAGVAVPHVIDTGSEFPCGDGPTTQDSMGYPFGFIQPQQSSDTVQPCSGYNIAASSVSSIANHTPGHQFVFNFINNTQFDESAFTQDLIILTLVGLFPASLIAHGYRLKLPRRKA